MNKLRKKNTAKGPIVPGLKSPFLILLTLLLGVVFWMASLPVARAATTQATPAQMLQANLPHSMNIASAPKADVLSAVCKTVTKNQKEAPQIVRTAAGARRNMTADILKTALHCMHDSKDPDCALARAALHEAITVNSEEAASLTELFVRSFPTCADSPEEGPDAAFGTAGITTVVASVSSGAAAGGDTCTVCHNNQPVQVPCNNLNSYLKNHPGDTAGACEASPNANR